MQQLELFNPHGLICPKCGTISPTQYMHDLNHGTMKYGMNCVTQRLTLRHIESFRKQGDTTLLQEALNRAHQLNLNP